MQIVRKFSQKTNCFTIN